jgi:diaminohydroxyphosphoribosylaminopyrimidine deaminase/5-amino-6-(5-phosphoribosylamino)uracil reductase
MSRPAPTWSAADEAFMRRALQLAARARGRVEPNPMVGCVIVRGGRVLGAGYHRRFGGAHAETEALRACRTSPREATVYVTLEPCCHEGKTPPCTRALIAARVGRVIAAMRDPNPAVRGRGLRALSEAAIPSCVGLLEAQARALNAPFAKLMQCGRPWVILKWAQSLDGKIATRAGDSRWISDEPARQHAHRIRGRMDAILVGVNTVVRDDPLLTARVGRPWRVATRVILDRRLRTPVTARVVATARHAPTLVVCGEAAAGRRARRLERLGCEVVRVAAGREGVSLEATLDALGARGMTNVLIEGGGRLLGHALDRRLADEAHIYVGPLLIGGARATGALHGEGPARLRDAVRLPADATWTRLGSGWVVSARLAHQDPRPR